MGRCDAVGAGLRQRTCSRRSARPARLITMSVRRAAPFRQSAKTTLRQHPASHPQPSLPGFSVIEITSRPPDPAHRRQSFGSLDVKPAIEAYSADGQRWSLGAEAGATTRQALIHVQRRRSRSEEHQAGGRQGADRRAAGNSFRFGSIQTEVAVRLHGEIKGASIEAHRLAARSSGSTSFENSGRVA